MSGGNHTRPAPSCYRLDFLNFQPLAPTEINDRHHGTNIDVNRAFIALAHPKTMQGQVLCRNLPRKTNTIAGMCGRALLRTVHRAYSCTAARLSASAAQVCPTGVDDGPPDRPDDYNVPFVESTLPANRSSRLVA